MTADVDVIIPVRNGGRLLKRAVDSVLAQEGVKVKVIVVDDGSTDGAPDRLPHDPRLTILRASGRGVPLALNAGLERGTARYVARQDADDESLPGRLATQLDHLAAHDGIGIVGTAFEVVVGNRTIATISPLPGGLLDRNQFCAGTVTARREVFEAVGGFRPVMSEDYDMWLRCAGIAGVSILPFVGYRYRLSAGMSTVRRCSRQQAYAELVRASARARLAGRPDPVDEMPTAPGDPAADIEVNAWWAHEFAALGSWRDALTCLRRLPRRRAVQELPRLMISRKPQAVWQ